MKEKSPAVVPVPDAPCAWCLTPEQIKDQFLTNPQSSHTICEKHAEEQYAKLQERRQRTKAARSL